MSDSLTLSALPQELLIHIFANLSYLDNVRLRAVCRSFRDLVGSQHFRIELEKCGHCHESLSPLSFFWKDEGLEWTGYDDTSQQWNRLPTLGTLLPRRAITRRPGELLGQSFLMSTSGGLVCTEVSRRDNVERIIVCNPLTRHSKLLPPLNLRGKPYLMQIIVDPSTKSYQVIVIGRRNDTSSQMKPEVYTSTTGQWEVRDYSPEPPATTKPILFHSSAVLNDIFFCLAHDGIGMKVLLAYSIRRGEWLNRWRCSLPASFVQGGHASRNAQLFECKKRIVLFWERYSLSQVGIVQMIFCFATLKKFEIGNDPEPQWSDGDLIRHKVITDLESAMELNGQTCSPCRSAPADIRCYAMVMTNRTGATRKCIVESNTEVFQRLPAPPVPQDYGNLHITSNPLSFSFEPSFIATV